MRTINITARESFLDEVVKLLRILAKERNEKDVLISQEYESRFNEYRDDIRAYDNGKLETLSIDELREEAKNW